MAKRYSESALIKRRAYSKKWKELRKKKCPNCNTLICYNSLSCHKHGVPAKLGKKISKEAKIKIGNASRGREVSLETREKQRLLHLGSKASNWKGGRTKLNKQIRSHYYYRMWRSKIFERDNYTCIFCQKRGGCLEADHYPILFFNIIEENDIQSIEQAIKCRTFWDTNNGRTLCQDCHINYTYRDLPRKEQRILQKAPQSLAI